MKRLNLDRFKVTKDAPNMIVRLANHISRLEETIEGQGKVVQAQQERIKLLEDELDLDPEFEEMKARAKELGIDFPHNIKKETLAEKIEDALEETEE